jgi:hypothetical protein
MPQKMSFLKHFWRNLKFKRSLSKNALHFWTNFEFKRTVFSNAVPLSKNEFFDHMLLSANGTISG